MRVCVLVSVCLYVCEWRMMFLLFYASAQQMLLRSVVCVCVRETVFKRKRRDVMGADLSLKQGQL